MRLRRSARGFGVLVLGLPLLLAARQSRGQLTRAQTFETLEVDWTEAATLETQRPNGNARLWLLVRKPAKTPKPASLDPWDELMALPKETRAGMRRTPALLLEEDGSAPRGLRLRWAGLAHRPGLRGPGRDAFWLGALAAGDVAYVVAARLGRSSADLDLFAALGDPSVSLDAIVTSVDAVPQPEPIALRDVEFTMPEGCTLLGDAQLTLSVEGRELVVTIRPQGAECPTETIRFETDIAVTTIRPSVPLS